jgi:hypothetical protein
MRNWIGEFLMAIGALGTSVFILLFIACWIVGIAEDKKYNGKPPKL